MLPEEEVLREEDERAPINNDRTRRRLNQLKGFMKHLLFMNDTHSTVSALNKECFSNDIDTEESKVCIMLYQRLKPYMPYKKHYALPSFQVPFVILASDILSYAGYRKFAVSLCPMPSTSVNALRLNSVSIYTLFCSYGESRLSFHDYENNEISTQAEALNQKDAVFNQFFDYETLQRDCISRKLKFAHNITVLPGAKYARILATKRENVHSSRYPQAATSGSRLNLPWKEIGEHWQRTKDNKGLLDAEIKRYEKSNKTTLQDIQVQRKLLDNLETTIKELKHSKWEKTVPPAVKENRPDQQPEKNQSLYQRLQKLKQERTKCYTVIAKLERILSDGRFQQYVRIKARSLKKMPTHTPTQHPQKVISAAPMIDKAENILLHSEHQYLRESFTFSGTDNGIVKMTESVPLTFNDFLYHLKLYNRSAALETGVEEQIEYKELPKPFTTHSGDIDLGGGFYRSRKRLEFRKSQNEEIVKIEKELSEQGLKKAITTAQIGRSYRTHCSHRRQLQDFYDLPNKEAHLKRKKEHINTKYRDRLCSKERQALGLCRKKNNVKNLIMFIGDRGTGVGRSIKGRRRYGGTWKQQKHARYTGVCITNENKTSQTCVYCFSSLSHPRATYTVLDKENKPTVVKRMVKGAFLCRNPHCVLSAAKRNTQTRDSISAVAIALSGLATVLFQDTFPQFRTKISQSNTEFNRKTMDFLNRSIQRAGPSRD